MHNWCLIMFINDQESQVFIRARRYIKKEGAEGREEPKQEEEKEREKK